MTGRWSRLSRSLVVVSGALTVPGVLTPGASAARMGGIEIAVQPDLVRRGDAFVIEADCQCEAHAATASASFLDRPVTLSREPASTRWRAILGIDLDRPPGAYTITLTFDAAEGSGPSAVHTLQVAERNFATRRLTVAPAFVDPPPDVERRIIDEAVRLRRLFSTATGMAPAGPAQPPIPTAVNSNFGSRSVFNGQPRSPHAGVDFSGAVGTPILAPAAATVALAGDLYFTGQTVVLDHGQGLFSILAHLSEITVVEGTRIEGGSVVGALGATGRVTGPHLHWGVRLHGARVDPLSILKVLGGA
jgi:murein DD-endopeptidase MepM/ murein hydrolase activator NlpD